MTKEMTLADALKAFNEIRATKNADALKEFITENGFWYDWFCSDSALGNKGINLMRRANAISGSKKFDNEKTYVWFKNNCTSFGCLYDDFRISDIETGDVLYTITLSDPHTNNKATVWGYENEFKEALFEGSWIEVRKWFLA